MPPPGAAPVVIAPARCGAAEACTEEVRLKPDFALARNNLAWALRSWRGR